jgi:hypothetical protein
MKQFARSVPVILFLSVASLSLIALAGCGSSGSGGPTAAKSLYAIQHSNNDGTEQDSVVVFSASATGTTTPTSTLMLPSNFYGVSLAVGPTGTIYVGGQQTTDAAFGEILEYPAGSSGTTTPSVTLNGSAAGTTTFTYPQNIAVNSAGTLFVSSFDYSLEAFASGFTASSAPTQYLTWGMSNFAYGGQSIAVDNAGEIFYADTFGDEIDVFAANATGATAPARQITGTNTASLDYLPFIAVDGAGDVYVANYNPDNDPAIEDSVGINPGSYAAGKSVFGMGSRGASHLMARPHVPDATYEPTEIIEFAAGASGTPTPTKRIGGAGATTNATNIVEPEGVAVDAVGNLYYADAQGGYWSDISPSVLLEVFPPSASGNVAPAASITSTSYTYDADFFGPPIIEGSFALGLAIH